MIRCKLLLLHFELLPGTDTQLRREELDLVLLEQSPSIEALIRLPTAIKAVTLVLKGIEEHLDIDFGQRWKPDNPEYIDVALRMEKEKFVEASKDLQRAVLARSMEMEKLNQPGTGTSLLLQVHSVLILSNL